MQRISEGWRPEKDDEMAGDRGAVAEWAPVSEPGRPHEVLHYVYFPKRAAARAAAIELQRQGFRTEERLGADGVNWLVLARHHIVPSEAALFAARQIIEGVASTGAGEYDGWEAQAVV